MASARIPWRRYAIPAAVFLSGLIFTAAAAVTTAHFVALRDREHFERLQTQALRAIDHSFDTYAALLRGMAALEATDGRPDPERMSRFLAVAGAPDRYPGLTSVGLAWWMGADADPAARSAAADYLSRLGATSPPGASSAVLMSYPVRPTTPKNIGSDITAERARGEAMRSARASGEARLSSSLLGFRTPGAGTPHLLLFMPIERAEPGAPGGRRFFGWVYGNLRNQGLFQTTLGDPGYLNEIGVKVYDGAMQPKQLIYASAPSAAAGGGAEPGDLRSVTAHAVAGRRWIVAFESTPKLERWPLTTTVLPIAAAGLAITLSISFATWLQAFGLTRAIEAERQAKAARDRGALLMNEVNHRVANSLQLVSTLVSMQTDQVKEPAAREALSETRSRIMAVARVHQRLYASGDVSSVALKPYLEGLVQALRENARRGVRLVLAAEDIALPTDKAVSLGIVAAELVTNALKYAYPVGGGEIRLILASEGESDGGRERRARFTVEDDGVGLAAAPPASSGLGMKIVRAMASGLRGEFMIDPPGDLGGHRVSLSFPLQ